MLQHNPEAIVQLYLQAGRDDARIQGLLELVNTLQLPHEICSRQELDQKVNHAAHQGVVALCKRIKREKDEAFLTSLLLNLDHPPFLLILDGVTDPHNLGACLRSAEAAGVDAIIVPKDKSAMINSTVQKVACGAAEIVPFIAVTNLARSIKALQERGIWVQGLAGEGDTSLYQADLTGPLALVLGSEGKGLRRLTREHCDALLSIPMAGEISSLNVSVTAGVCLFEAVRQRSSGKTSPVD
ncbi:MAG: 23S rRNA (guanosine(2251)-2'-O)-methyltransferase RlmB [Pseudohongiellaceae bacterium]